MTAPGIEAAGLTIRRGGRTVVHGLDFAMRSADCVVLVGPNGSGKTTLMLALLGLLDVTGGLVRMNGVDIRALSARARARFAAYVPQGLERVPALRVRDVVAGGRYPHVGATRAHSQVDRWAVEQALERCGLTELADRPLNTLSGGERQKTLIAAAFAQDPAVLCLDEPNAALDPAYQLELVRILRAWHRGGRGLLVISHDLQLPAALGGRVVAMSAGRIAADGPAEEILTPGVLGRIYGAPFAAVQVAGGAAIVLPRWWTSG